MVKRTKVIPVTICALASVLVQPGFAQPSDDGQWEPLLTDWQLQAIHMVLMKNGKVLCLDHQSRSPNVIVVDPSDPSNPTVPQYQMPRDYYCSGHAQLGDGRILFAGGGPCCDGHRFAHTFDPDRLDLGQDPWEPMEPIVMPGGERWYATATALGNGLVLLTAGRDKDEPGDPDAAMVEDIPALFNVSPPLSDPQWTRMDETARKVIHYYPFMFQLSNGRVFMGGGARFRLNRTPSIHLDTYNLNVATEQWALVHRGSEPGMSAVMYRPDRVMKAGCGLGCGETPGATNTVQVIDLASLTPQWIAVDPMNYARKRMYLIPLPDGRVFAVGGEDENGESVMAAEWYDPDEQPSPLWKVLADMSESRRRHMSAVLLPDARVLMGGGQLGGPQTTAEIFKPPYLFNSQNVEIDPDTGERPKITSAPDEVIYNTAFSVATPQAAQITKVSLIRLGAATHSFDQNTRFVPLDFVSTPVGDLSVAAPAHGNIAPPGYYMLFILKDGDRAGIEYPSEAKILRLTTSGT